MNTKQVIIIRKDLKMRRGKELAQGSHAVLKVFFDLGFVSKDNPDGSCEFTIPLTPAMRHWVTGQFTKIALSTNSETDLLEAYNKAKEAGLPCALIQDAGHTEVAPGTYTAVSIGPDEVEKIDLITKNSKYSLY